VDGQAAVVIFRHHLRRVARELARGGGSDVPDNRAVFDAGEENAKPAGRVGGQLKLWIAGEATGF